MRVLELFLMIVIAGVFGFVATQLMGARRVNVLVMVLFGFVGALVGRFAATLFSLPRLWSVNLSGHEFPLVWSILGCLLVVGIVSGINQQST